MKKQSFLFYLASLTIYLIVASLQSAGAATHPLAQKGTHVCGVSDSWGANGIRINTQTGAMPDPLQQT